MTTVLLKGYKTPLCLIITPYPRRKIRWRNDQGAGGSGFAGPFETNKPMATKTNWAACWATLAIRSNCRLQIFVDFCFLEEPEVFGKGRCPLNHCTTPRDGCGGSLTFFGEMKGKWVTHNNETQKWRCMMWANKYLPKCSASSEH